MDIEAIKAKWQPIFEKYGHDGWHGSSIVGELMDTVAEVERLQAACISQSHEIEQVLGRALGYPRYADDQVSSPGATGDAVCIGYHTAESLADEAAARIAGFAFIIAELRGETVAERGRVKVVLDPTIEAEVAEVAGLREIAEAAEAKLDLLAADRDRWQSEALGRMKASAGNGGRARLRSQLDDAQSDLAINARLLARQTDLAREAEIGRAAAEAREVMMREAVTQVQALMDESRGVVGLHLNGDDADWEWLINNEWLSAFAHLATPGKAAEQSQAVIAAARTLVHGDCYGTSEHRSTYYALCKAVEALDSKAGAL